LLGRKEEMQGDMAMGAGIRSKLGGIINKLFTFVFLLVISSTVSIVYAKPSIVSCSSSGGHTKNKDGPQDRMYLVKGGDKITFTVKAEGAERYIWQVNKKVQKGAEGNTFTFTVPNEKGIWEIHVIAVSGKDKAHAEWVVSTLTKSEAPDFFEYFTDGKYKNRTETDPWGRKLPEWKSYSGKCNLSKGFLYGDSGVLLGTHASDKIKYGTWLFRLQTPNGYMGTPGGSTYLSFGFMGCMGNWSPSRGVAISIYPATDGHFHGGWGMPGGKGVDINFDVGWKVNIARNWATIKMIRTPDGYMYFLINDYAISRGITPTDLPREPMLSIRYSGPYRNPKNMIHLDNIEVYENKFLLPKETKYGSYVHNWVYNHNKGKWVSGNWQAFYDPVYKKGIVVRGKSIRLSDIAKAISNPKIFYYDRKTKIADCFTNLIVADNAELIIDGETLRFHCSSPGEHELSIMYGSTLIVKNSTITSADDNYFLFRITGPVYLGYTAYLMNAWQLKESVGINQSLFYMGLQTIDIHNSTINNTGFMYFDSPLVLRIINTKLLNLHEVEVNAKNYAAAPADSEARRRKDFVRGKKSLWIFYRDHPIYDFAMENVKISGSALPSNITFAIDKKQGSVNIYNVNFGKNNIAVRHNTQMESGWYSNKKKLPTELGLVNCKYKGIVFSTDRAEVVSKYYLDVKVVDKSGRPIKGAKVSIINEADKNYPAENMMKRCEFLSWKEQKKRGIRSFYFSSFTPITSTYTNADGHTPLPMDKKGTIIVADFVQDKLGKKEFAYTIIVEKNGLKKVVKGVNPNSMWYRPDPNKPTYTITAVLDGKTTTEEELKKQGLAGKIRP